MRKVRENLIPSLRESLRVEAIPDQENHVSSVEWAESLVWIQARPMHCLCFS